MGKQTNKKPKVDSEVKEVAPGYPDTLFYKGDFIPEITPDPPVDSDIFHEGHVKELIPGINWRKSGQRQEKFKEQTGWEEKD